MRCARASELRAEPQVGTASTVLAFLLVESPGAWGVDAPEDSRLPQAAKDWIAQQTGVRPLLIRRHTTKKRRVFLSSGGRLKSAEVDDLHELPDLDLARDLSPYDGPLFLVCTHGRHDACCAERGRPLWAAMDEAAPEETWQVSHIGGDRFAANVLVLPDGLYYGRVQPEDAAAFVQRHRNGLLDLEHLRGRCSYTFATQAAEVFLRRELGEERADVVHLVSAAWHVAVFDVLGKHWQVEVERVDTYERLTCRSAEPLEGWTFSLTALKELG